MIFFKVFQEIIQIKKIKIFIIVNKKEVYILFGKK